MSGMASSNNPVDDPDWNPLVTAAQFIRNPLTGQSVYISQKKIPYLESNLGLRTKPRIDDEEEIINNPELPETEEDAFYNNPFLRPVPHLLNYGAEKENDESEKDKPQPLEPREGYMAVYDFGDKERESRIRIQREKIIKAGKLAVPEGDQVEIPKLDLPPDVLLPEELYPFLAEQLQQEAPAFEAFSSPPHQHQSPPPAPFTGHPVPPTDGSQHIHPPPPPPPPVPHQQTNSLPAPIGPHIIVPGAFIPLPALNGKTLPNLIGVRWGVLWEQEAIFKHSEMLVGKGRVTALHWLYQLSAMVELPEAVRLLGMDLVMTQGREVGLRGVRRVVGWVRMKRE